jgi:hypothetical protein
MYNIIIFGSGFSGLTVAHELIDKGYKVILYENDSLVGGMAKTRRERDFIPSEHSWRGFGPFYKNFFNIAKRIPTYNNKTVFNNLNRPIEFINLTDNSINSVSNIDNINSGKPIANNDKIFTINDSLWIKYMILKYLVSNKRKGDFYDIKLDTMAKRLNNPAYKQIMNYLLGPGFGMEKKDASCGHFCKFAGIMGMKHKKYNYYYKINDKKYFNTAGGEWHLLNQPTNEGIFDPWVKYLKGKGLKLYLNHELVQINYKYNYITSCLVKNLKTKDIFSVVSNYYVLCINPFNAESIFKKSCMNDLYYIHAKMNENTISNQISFRIGFKKKIKLPKNLGCVLRDSEFNITLYSQDNYWNDDIILSESGNINSLWSGTLLFTTLEKGQLYNKPAIYLTKKQLENEIKYQVLKCGELQRLIYKNNGLKINKNDITYFELWYEVEFDQNQSNLSFKYPKWVNNVYNEKFRPNQKTNYSNLFLGGAHTKTSIEIWSMEGAVESGKIVSKYICNKPIYHFIHSDNDSFRILKIIDDFLYNLRMPNILDLILIFIVIIIIKVIYKIYNKK